MRVGLSGWRFWAECYLGPALRCHHSDSLSALESKAPLAYAAVGVSHDKTSTDAAEVVMKKLMMICLAVLAVGCTRLHSQCPARREANGQLASPDWCIPRRRPQVMPAPQADPNSGGWQSTPQAGGYVPGNQGSGQSQPLSNKCYVSLPPNPVAGCYMSSSAPSGTGCGCYDANGNLYQGIVWY
jgi:hypothetical protein